ncbi:MAG TPA: bifunctional anthranilate synthase component I family protein/class IV aminotransferase [Paucimonas sp.]|nr:bifunctional anthranilate synthase component I family protein/class IV aminotransferase [Paucimonas sp.]
MLLSEPASVLHPVVPDDCFVLLDDCNATAAAPRSRLYTDYAGVLSCTNVSELVSMLERMADALQAGLHAVGLFAYELGAELHAIAAREEWGRTDPAQILLFRHCERLSADQVGRWLQERECAAQRATGNASSIPAGIGNVRSNIDGDEFAAAIARIHAYIAAGDTYQVNYTYRVRFDVFGSPVALYRHLRERQPVPHGAFAILPDGRAILSLSPELFIRHTGGQVVVQPMKGTAAATGDAGQDSANAAVLAADPKNRAENLMIVDLLRNDLGRIAHIGSVKASRLFEVARYGSVLQMTSSVHAQLRDDATLSDILAALYPCGSITGAPKHRTMQLIRELEPHARGLYTGAIGWFDAPAAERRIGDFCLSVPIRTLVLQAPASDGVRVGEMGIGAGIVHDSVAADEYAECRLKAGFLTCLGNDFELFETMHVTRLEGCRHFDRHLRRLQASAAYFNFPCDRDAVHQAVQRACADLPLHGAYRMRLALRDSGEYSIQVAPLAPLSGPVRVILADQATLAEDLFLRHKSSVRDRYDAAWRAAEAQGAFDMLFCNADGELTEGARSNIFVKLDGRWHTPPLACGLLPGVMRAVLLEDPAWGACERRLVLDDLRNAQEVAICNALRGVLPVTVTWNVQAG